MSWHDYDFSALARKVKETLQEPMCILPLTERFFRDFEAELKKAGCTNYRVAPITHHTPEGLTIAEPRRPISTHIDVIKHNLTDSLGKPKTALIFDDEVLSGQSMLGALCYIADNVGVLGIIRIYTLAVLDVPGYANFAQRRASETFSGPHKLIEERARNIYEEYSRNGTLEIIDNGCYFAGVKG